MIIDHLRIDARASPTPYLRAAKTPHGVLQVLYYSIRNWIRNLRIIRTQMRRTYKHFLTNVYHPRP